MKSNRGTRAFQAPASLNPSKPPRAERVAKQIREEISQLMVREMKDPRVRLASISSVELSHDLRHARVMVSAIGDEKERHAVVTALRHASGYLRSQIGGRLENLKATPTLRFELDESIAYSIHISAMLREMQATAEAEAANADPNLKPYSDDDVEILDPSTEPQP